MGFIPVRFGPVKSGNRGDVAVDSEELFPAQAARVTRVRSRDRNIPQRPPKRLNAPAEILSNCSTMIRHAPRPSRDRRIKPNDWPNDWGRAFQAAHGARGKPAPTRLRITDATPGKPPEPGSPPPEESDRPSLSAEDNPQLPVNKVESGGFAAPGRALVPELSPRPGAGPAQLPAIGGASFALPGSGLSR